MLDYDYKKQRSTPSIRSRNVLTTPRISIGSLNITHRNQSNQHTARNCSPLRLKYDKDGDAIGIHREDRFEPYLEESFYIEKINKNASFKNQMKSYIEKNPIIGMKQLNTRGEVEDSLEDLKIEI